MFEFKLWKDVILIFLPQIIFFLKGIKIIILIIQFKMCVKSIFILFPWIEQLPKNKVKGSGYLWIINSFLFFRLKKDNLICTFCEIIKICSSLDISYFYTYAFIVHIIMIMMMWMMNIIIVLPTYPRLTRKKLFIDDFKQYLIFFKQYKILPSLS